MRWVVIGVVLVVWFVLPAVFGALGQRDAKDFEHGVKSVVHYNRR